MTHRLHAYRPPALLGAAALIGTALFVSIVFASPSSPTSAAFPGGNGKIAFESERDGNAEVYVMNPDGTEQTRLTTATALDFSPRWSPDGSKIGFNSSRDGTLEIYIMNADGSAQTRLTNNPAADRETTWSPDGTKIAFASNRTGVWQIYVMNADGSQQTQLTSVGLNFGPAWSPDGSKIAFSRFTVGTNHDIYVMNADGGNQTQLTNGAASESGPDWSPDGARLVYSSGTEIYSMNADGSDNVNLTNHPANDGVPAWSPDGSKVVFTSNRGGNAELYVMNADGSAQTLIFDSHVTESGPDWQPLCEGATCPLATPLPTATPCPDAGCPTPTPSLTPTPLPMLDFSIGTDPAGGAESTCSSSSAPTDVCQVPAGSSFTVGFYLDTLPAGLPGGKYQGYDMHVTYSGVTQPGTEASLDFSPWPDCYYDAFYLVSGTVAAGCAVAAGSPGSAYVGRLLTVQFTCTADGTITLVHGNGGTDLVDGPLSSLSEGQGTSESVAIDCVSPPTATPTATPTPCPTADCLDFSIGVDVYSGGGNECSSSGSPTNTCLVAANGTFSVEFYLHSLPVTLPGASYAGFDAVLQYTGVTTGQTAESVQFDWPACAKDASAFPPGTVAFGCAIGTSAAESTYTGLMASVEFTCAADGTVTLVHGAGGTGLVDSSLAFFDEGQDATEGIAINCVTPLSPPGDSDGDRCPDMKEVGSSPMAGGRRNFLNPWDYFNPSHDGQNRIDDVLMVRDQYFIDVTNPPAYSGQYDRSYLGPDPWNLGPPNGQIRVDDILAARDQYFDDCS